MVLTSGPSFEADPAKNQIAGPNHSRCWPRETSDWLAQDVTRGILSPSHPA